MKSILLIFFFFIFVNISYANEWVLVSDNQNAVVHQIVDITSIREVSNNVFYLHKQLQEENDDHYANVLVTVDFNKNIEAWDSIALCNKNRLGVVDFLDRTSFLLDEDELNKIFYVYLKSKSDFNRKVEKINLKENLLKNILKIETILLYIILCIYVLKRKNNRLLKIILQKIILKRKENK